MRSRIAEAVKLKYSPVALIWSDEKPEDALEFKEGRWGCAIALLCAASKGRTAVAGRQTMGCNGGAVGLGFGDLYEQFPGGIEHFLSNGNQEFAKTEAGRKLAETRPDMLHGERYIKTPELARKFIDSLPIRDIPARYVVLKPLEMVAEDEEPKVVIFMANPDQISALNVLANYGREDSANVLMPMGAGCHQIGILAYREAESEKPRAILGLTDLSARKISNRAVGKDMLTFAVPFKMYMEMEENVEGSFLYRDTWAEVLKISEE